MNGAFEKLAQAGNYWHKQRLVSSLSQGTAILTSPKCHKTNSANCGRRGCSALFRFQMDPTTQPKALSMAEPKTE